MENNESNNNNKKLVDKTKKTLNEMGFDIKTGQVYELYSKILNHPSYNVAKAKNEDFEKAFNNVNFEPPKNEQELSRFEKFCNDVGLGLEGLQKHYNYLEALERGDFKDKFFYGISKEKDGFALLNPFTDPGALYVGKMGSGKSIGMKMTLLTHMLANGDNSIYFLFDAFKGMADYKEFFYLNNVISITNNEKNLIPMIDILYKELSERKDLMKDYNSILSYEKDSKNQVPRIVVAIEEAHFLNHGESNQLKYSYRKDNFGTPAFKLKELMRIGRSHGITFLMATQKATGDQEIPFEWKSGLSMENAFKITSPNDITFMESNLREKSLEIPVGKPGRCFGNNDFGEIQYPIIRDTDINLLLLKYVSQYKKIDGLTFSLKKIKPLFNSETGVDKNIKESISILSNLKNVLIPSNHKKSANPLEELFKKTVGTQDEFNSLFINESLKDNFFLGQKLQNGFSFNLNNIFELSSIGFFGGMGSGKSISLALTATLFLINNSENTELLVIDTLKGAGDFSHLFKYKQVSTFIKSKEKAQNAIDNVYKEFLARQKSINNNDQSQKQKELNRIVVAIENLTDFLKEISYNSENHKEGSTAFKFKNMLLNCKGLGIIFLLASTKADKDSVHNSILDSFSIKLTFGKLLASDYSEILGSESNMFKFSEKLEVGNCISSSGNQFKFPHFWVNELDLSKYIKNPSGQNLT